MSAYIIDTETTGIIDPVPVQVAWINVTSLLANCGEFEEKFRPGKPISFGAMATHHIIESDLEECEPFSSFRLPEDCHFLISHNIDFDWLALGKPDVKRICTLAMARSLYPDLDSHSLGAMSYALNPPGGHEDIRENLRNCHDALSDALMTLELLRLLVRKLNILYPVDFNQLWEESELARIPKIMSFGKHKGMKVGDVPSDYRRWYSSQPDADPYLLKAWKMQTGQVVG